ncbi:pyruvate decarboxylase PdcB [Sporodiniella umbellata]|nr:pyruvate decarboxylase PdcB [Sporodiniella umbellata]
MKHITVAQHLVNRLKEINIDTIFGVLPFLEKIDKDSDLTWGGSTNELNASYAADGYARIRGAGALCTGFGVGELSAANGIAGSYAEMVPVIHIVGIPTAEQIDSDILIHHSVDKDREDVFFQIASNITCASTQLTPLNAIAEIDRVISKSLICKRPGYIAIPLDLFDTEVSIPEDLSPLQTKLPKNPPLAQDAALKAILQTIKNSKFPIIVVDVCVSRQRIQKIVQAFIERSGFPTYVTPMGKGSVDEHASTYRGVFHKEIGFEATEKEVMNTDLIIEIGAFKSYLNTSSFFESSNQPNVIALHSFATIVSMAYYKDVSMEELLPSLTEALPKIPRCFKLAPRACQEPDSPGSAITHKYLWNKLPAYLEENSIICTESGNTIAPKNTFYISQLAYGSIGFSVGAAVGAAIAARERRVYLILGDDAFQVSCQEIGIFLRRKLTPVVILLNNRGYYVERPPSEPEPCCTKVQNWCYGRSLDYFGAYIESNVDIDSSYIGFQGTVSTQDEFEQAMEKTLRMPNSIHFLELVTPKTDLPRGLKRINAKELLKSQKNLKKVKK